MSDHRNDNTLDLGTMNSLNSDATSNPEARSLTGSTKVQDQLHPTVRRRQLFSFAALSAAIASTIRCSGGDSAFRGSSKERNSESVDSVPVDAAPNLPPDATPTLDPSAKTTDLLSTEDPFSLCEKPRRDVRTLSDIANPGEQAKVVIYGKPKHAMIVVELPTFLKSSADSLKSVSIHKEDGLFLAQYILTEADLRTIPSIDPALPASLLYWPFVFKNMSIRFGEALYVRYTFSESSEFKQLLPASMVNPMLTFRGLEVKSVTDVKILDTNSNNAIATGMDKLSPEVNFAESDSVGIPETSNTQYNFSSFRKLRTAQANAKYNPATGLSSFVITDLSGNVLSENGGAAVSSGGFVDIMNHPNFACYKLVSQVPPLASYWVRTVVSTG